MRIWYTKSYNVPTNFPAGEFADQIRDLHMGYDWYLEMGHNPITIFNINETHDIAIDSNDLDTMTDLEVVFTKFQGEFMPDDLYNYIRGRKVSHTSMSVGDVIETSDGALHFVDVFGFVTLGSK